MKWWHYAAFCLAVLLAVAGYRLVIETMQRNAPDPAVYAARARITVESFDRRNQAFLGFYAKRDAVIHERIKPLVATTQELGKSLLRKVDKPNPGDDTRREFDRYVSLQCKIEQLVDPDALKTPSAVNATHWRTTFNEEAKKYAGRFSAPVLQFVCQG